MKDIWNILSVIAVVLILGVQGYLFFFAPCWKVQAAWYLVQTPARCLNWQYNGANEYGGAHN